MAVVTLDEDELTVVETPEEEVVDRTGVIVEVETELDDVDELVGLVVDEEDEDDDAKP